MSDELNYSDMNWCHREIESLREQLAFAMAHPTEVERTLREQVSALTKERDEWKEKADELGQDKGTYFRLYEQMCIRLAKLGADKTGETT